MLHKDPLKTDGPWKQEWWKSSGLELKYIEEALGVNVFILG